MDINPKILHRFFSGHYSRKDYIEVKTLFTDYNKKPELRNHLQKHWNEFVQQGIQEKNVDHLLDKIHYKINLEEGRKRNYGFVVIFQKMAAILIIPLLLSFLAVLYFHIDIKRFDNQVYAEIQCPLGARIKFELPDGTTGFLNSGSKLKYAVGFVNGRKVDVSGEAYFNVIHDGNPFEVQTSLLNVKVLGTEFNVIAYDDELQQEVILNRGEVEIYNKSGAELGTLQPNQKLVIDTENGVSNIKYVEASQYTGWTGGKLIFRNESMVQVAKRLGRWYNADFKIVDPELYKYNFRATFVDESLDEVLKLMALTAPFKFEEQPRQMSNYTYQKRLFKIKLDKDKLKAFN